MVWRRHITRRFLIRWLLGAVLALLLVCGAWTPVCLWRFQVAITAPDVGRAEVWLDRADTFPWTAGERAFWRARLSRQLGRMEAYAASIEHAQRAGFPVKQLQREDLLRRAQSGDLAPLEAQISDLLIRGEDLPAICDAYVGGCIQQYRIEDALRVLQLWQDDFPVDPQPHFLRGRLFEHRGALGEAETEYRESLRLAPRHAPAAYNLARILLQKQAPAQALEAYRIAAEGLFESQPGLVGIARCQRELNQWDAARDTLQQAVARPIDRLVEAYRYLGEQSEAALAQVPAEMAQLEIATSHDEEAVTWLQHALEAYPQDWKLRYTYSTTLARLGRTAEAQAESARSQTSRVAFESCDRLMDRLNQNPADLEARYEVGCVLLEHFSVNQGLVWLNSVLAYDPHHRAAHARLAEYFSAHASENAEFPKLAEQHRQAALAEERSIPAEQGSSP